MVNRLSTARDLEALARDYQANLFAGQLGVCDTIAAELCSALKINFSSACNEDLPRPLASFSTCPNLSADDTLEFQRRMDALVAMQQEVIAFQREHQISGLIEEVFVFEPLDFCTTQLRCGFWLTLMDGDAEPLRANSTSNVMALKALANSTGRDWLRYKEKGFTLETGKTAFRFVPDQWADLETVMAGGTAAHLSNSNALDFGLRSEQMIELGVYEFLHLEEEESESTSFLLVHPTSNSDLDDPTLFWGGNGL